ncbi:MAG: hypothetical protein QOH88_1439 [Verrucomicrobiota bacterium]|jgi:DNA-binding NarL/FixJ family response regulator
MAVRCLKKFFGPRPNNLFLPEALAQWAQDRPEIPFCLVKEDRMLFVTWLDRSRKGARFFLLEEHTNWEKCLTAREAAVILWAARGKTNQDIAEIMGLKEATVKTYMFGICQKLGVENRTAAASYAEALPSLL